MTYNPNSRGIPTLSRATSTIADNNTGSTIPKMTPVRLTNTGLALINVSIEAEANAIEGLTNVSIPNAGQGEVINSGLLNNVTTSALVGDIMYISKTGDLTNIKPSIGVAGFVATDWVVRVGVIVKDHDNPLQLDLLVNIQVVGEL